MGPTMHAFMAEAVLVEVEAVLQAHIWQATFSGKRPLTPVYAHLNCYDVHHVQPTDGPSGRRTCQAHQACLCWATCCRSWARNRWCGTRLDSTSVVCRGMNFMIAATDCFGPSADLCGLGESLRKHLCLVHGTAPACCGPFRSRGLVQVAEWQEHSDVAQVEHDLCRS